MNVVVLLTTLAGYYLATRQSIQLSGLLLTLMGTALAAAGASVLNQVMERDLDALMPRTADRPIPAGRVRASDALYFGLLLALAGVVLLAIDVNILTAFLCMITLASYLLVYTPAKRVTTLCTLLGAVPGAIPVMMGCTAATSRVTPIAIVLFMILFIWQIPHFLSIAILYGDDYGSGGFRMLPSADRQLQMTGRQIVLYCLALVPVTVCPVVLGIAGWGYLAAALALNVMFTWFGIRVARSQRRQDARRLFLGSLGYIICLLLSMTIDHV
jgi:protoheme IX farnesyltransferase